MAIETFETAWLKVHFDPDEPDDRFVFRAMGMQNPALDEAEAIRLAQWINDMVARASVKELGTGSGWTT